MDKNNLSTVHQVKSKWTLLHLFIVKIFTLV